MILRSFGGYLEYNRLRADSSVLGGVIRPEKQKDGSFKFFNALTGQTHDTFDDAKRSALQLGVTAAEGTGLRGSGPRVKNQMIQQISRTVQQAHPGKDVSVDLLTMNLTGEKVRFITDLVQEQGLLMMEDGTHARALRIMVDGKYLDRASADKYINDAGYFFGENTPKFGKRAKAFVSPKQLELDIAFGQFKMGVFNPLDLLTSADPMADRLREIFDIDSRRIFDEMDSLVQERYGTVNRTGIINALRGMGIEDPAFKSMTRGQLLGELTQAKTRAATLKTFDGQGIISSAIFESTVRDLEKKLPTLRGAERKQALRYLKELTYTDDKGIRHIATGRVFNVRASGMRLERLMSSGVLGGIPEDELVALMKGNYIVMDAAEMAARYGVGIDILTVEDNISYAKAGSAEATGQRVATRRPRPGTEERALFTAEPNKPKTMAFFDILTPSTGSDAITKEELERGYKLLKQSVDAISEAVHHGVPIDPESRAFAIFKDSIEAGLEGENQERAEKMRRLITQLEEGDLPANQLPVLIERFKESLFRDHFGKQVPRIPLPTTARAYSASSSWAKGAGLISKRVTQGTIEIAADGLAVFSDTDIERYFHGLGGFDLDDSVNVVYRGDKDGGFNLILYRQPDTTDEIAEFKIKNAHRSQALKRILREQTTFAESEAKIKSLNELIYSYADEGKMVDKAKEAGLDADLVNMLQDIWKRVGYATPEGQEKIAQVMDELAIERAMNKAGKELDKIEGPIIGRGMSGARFREMTEDGKVSFPGVTRKIGGQDFTFSYQTLEKLKGKPPGVLDRIATNATQSSLLGRWVNSKATLGMWLDINKKTLEGLTDPDQIQAVMDFLNKEGQFQEEAIIDALVQGRSLTVTEQERLERRIAMNWEEQARLTMQIPGLKMEKYMVEQRMPKGFLRDQLIEGGFLDEGLPSFAMSLAKEVEGPLEELGERAAKNLLKDVEVSEAARRHADAILSELSDLGDQLPEEDLLPYQKLTLQRRFFSAFEGADRRFGQQAAELYVALSKDGRFAGLVRDLDFLDESVQTIRGNVPDITLDTHFVTGGKFVMPTPAFSEMLGNIGIKQGDLDRLADAAIQTPDGVKFYGLGNDELWFDSQGQLLPQSVIDVGDRQVVLGEALAGETEDLKELADSLAVRVRDEASALGRIQQQPVLPLPKTTQRGPVAAVGDKMRHGLGNMMGEIWGHFGSTGRRVSAAAVIVVAASMVANSRRDREYTEDQIGPPKDVPELYNQGLAMTQANYSSLTGTYGTTYDIRTRGGKMPSGFLQTLAEIAGADVYADTYRDPLNDQMLQDALRNYR